jgi:hypothetical protein
MSEFVRELDGGWAIRVDPSYVAAVHLDGGTRTFSFTTTGPLAWYFSPERATRKAMAYIEAMRAQRRELNLRERVDDEIRSWSINRMVSF